MSIFNNKVSKMPDSVDGENILEAIVSVNKRKIIFLNQTFIK